MENLKIVDNAKLSDNECIERLQQAAEALLREGAAHSQVVGALTAAIAKVAWMTPQQANRSLRLAVDILTDAAGRTPYPPDDLIREPALN